MAKVCKKTSAHPNLVKTLQLNCQTLSHRQLQMLCGSLDEHLNFIENHYQVRIQRQSDKFMIHGGYDNAKQALDILARLAAQTAHQPINIELLRSMILGFPLPSGSRHFVSPRHLSQKKYLDKIESHTITFGIGPAGTGKTYLAVAQAVRFFKEQQVDKIILTRPAVEAGERLGFLPGDLQQKVDPYLRPLFDALNELLGADCVNRLVMQHTIEVAPLAFMRGRTLSRSFIILDEAQNTTQNQMKLFLTRLGEGSKMVITGDLTQIDLPDPKQSGLAQVSKVLRNINDISFHFFEKSDIVRHPLVTKIIDSYDHAHC
jgi:phosphate starvation-inducible PhoH-like protein